MRSVERTPWSVRRSSMHDAICLLVVDNVGKTLRLVSPAEADLIGAVEEPKSVDKVTVEAPCGTGFCDVLVETDGRTRAWFIEVKTDDERASMGDIIRQLRWYSAQRGGFEEKNLVLVCETLPSPRDWMLLLHAGVRVLPKFALERRKVAGEVSAPAELPEYPWKGDGAE
jgi:hypothetical protein